MNSKEIINAILSGKRSDRVGFWSGEPHPDTEPVYFEHFKVANTEELTKVFENDLCHIMAEIAWPHSTKPMFDFYGGEQLKSLNQPGVFSECETIAEIEAHNWPDADLLDFSILLAECEKEAYHNQAVLSGMWSMFYHDMMSYFGMDNYFMKMYTNPKVIEAATERIVQFYLDANEKCFTALGDKMDAFFFGNDFGSQESLLISPECFKKFILPGFSKLIDQAKSHGLKVILHSCGSIAEVIPLLIDAGIDALHPLQARAKGMDAEYLAREYKKDIAFIGGVDTQWLLPYGTPEQVKTEVRRLKKIFGERFIVSPSHESILLGVHPENILAMREAAFE